VWRLSSVSVHFGADSLWITANLGHLRQDSFALGSVEAFVLARATYI